MRFLKKVEDLPYNSKVILYGAGEGGRTFRSLVEANRQDINLVCFVDDFRSGEKDGMKIITPKDLYLSEYCDFLILITSAHWRNMLKKLKPYNIKDIYIVNPLLLFNSQIFTEKEEKEYKVNFDNVKKLLEYNEDRILYDLILETRKCVQEDTIDPFDYFRNTFKEPVREYLDFINFEKIYTIIEGGVFDGENTVEFLNLLSNDGFIYGFEPLYEVYIKSKFRNIIEKRANVKIYPLALWSHSNKLMFSMNDSNENGFRVVNHNEKSSNNLKPVDAISIDEFLEENNINKVDFIKMDIEGAELEALKGARETIKEYRPQLSVCIYHKKQHIFEIPLFLNSFLENYVYRIGHYSSSFWDTVWYAIPKEYLKKL